MLTRSVDATIASLLDGRVQYDAIPTLHDSLRPGTTATTNTSTTGATQTKRKKLTIKDCHRSFEERKKSLLEHAKRYLLLLPGVHNDNFIFLRRYIEKYGLPSR